jgi:predicted nuclease with TOPRIM domain
MKLILLIILAFSFAIAQQDQQPTARYSVDDLMRKLESIDNSFNQRMENLRFEFEQKLSEKMEELKDDFRKDMTRVESKFESRFDELQSSLSRKLDRISTQNRGLRNQLSKIEGGVGKVSGNVSEVQKSVQMLIGEVSLVGDKVAENATKFDEVISKLGTNQTTAILGFIIIIVLSSVLAILLLNLFRFARSAEQNIRNSIEQVASKFEVSTGDLKSLIDVLKQQTAEVNAYQKILEERIISAQKQLEASFESKLEEKLPKRRRARKSAGTES